MFIYPDKSNVNTIVTTKEMLNLLGPTKQLKKDVQSIKSIEVKNILTEKNTNLKSSEQVKEIYVIDIVLGGNEVPYVFLDAFNKYINFQVLFRIHKEDEVKYILYLKKFSANQFKVLKTFETDWKKKEVCECKNFISLEDVFKSMIQYITSYKVREKESFDEFISRLDTINKIKKQIKSKTRVMNAEKQPNIKMKLNDEIKQMKKELQMLE